MNEVGYRAAGVNVTVYESDEHGLLFGLDDSEMEEYGSDLNRLGMALVVAEARIKAENDFSSEGEP